MELKIINKKEDPLLSRTIVESEMVFENATPSRAEIKGKLAKDLGKDEKLVVVKGIYTSYGLKKAKNIAYIYENEEFLKRIEGGTKKKGARTTSGTNSVGKKKGPAEAKEKAEEKPQEQAKKEESKQEARQEEKPKAKAEAKQKSEKPKDQKEAREKGK